MHDVFINICMCIYIYYLSWLRLEYLIKSNGDIGNEEYIHPKKTCGVHHHVLHCHIFKLQYMADLCVCMHASYNV